MTEVYKEITVQSVVFPLIPVGHPKYVWTAAADVHSTWRKYSWKPLSEQSKRTPQLKLAGGRHG